MNTIPDIKTIIPLTCPDCKHEIVVSLRLPTPAAPEYLEASNPTLIQASKEELMTYIDTLEMPKEEKNILKAIFLSNALTLNTMRNLFIPS